jgi:hypothetical protein
MHPVRPPPTKNSSPGVLHVVPGWRLCLDVRGRSVTRTGPAELPVFADPCDGSISAPHGVAAIERRL